MALPCQTRLLARGGGLPGVLGAAFGGARGGGRASSISVEDLSLPGAARRLDAALGATGFAVVTSRDVPGDALHTIALELFRQPFKSKQRFIKWWIRGFGSFLHREDNTVRVPGGLSKPWQP